MSCIVQTPEKYRPARHENHDTENYKREHEEKTEESDSSATCSGYSDECCYDAYCYNAQEAEQNPPPVFRACGTTREGGIPVETSLDGLCKCHDIGSIKILKLIVLKEKSVRATEIATAHF